MSLTRCQVVLSSREAWGRLLPAPRWSNRTIRYAAGSKKRRWKGSVPPPGPPWTKTTGLPVRVAALLVVDLVDGRDLQVPLLVRLDLRVELAHGRASRSSRFRYWATKS